MMSGKGQFLLIGFCAFQTLLNVHLLRQKMTIDREAEMSELSKVKTLQKCRQNLQKCTKKLESARSVPECPEEDKSDQGDEKFNTEPAEFSVGPPPKIFSLSEFNFTSTPFPVLDECSCESGKEALHQATSMHMKDVQYIHKFKDRTASITRKKRHEDYLKRREWSRPLKIFSNPSVPLKYPSSGVQCRPHGQTEIPMLVTQFFESAKIKIVAKYGKISVGVDGTAKQSLDLEGDSTYLNKLLQSLVYTNVMYDSIMYYDTVTVWIRGFEAAKFQVEVSKEKLEVLQPIDPSTAAGKPNELVTIIIKTFIRYPCMIRLVQSIRQFYPFITIIIADDSPDNVVPGDNEDFKKIQNDKHIKYIKLPEKTGWNAGRAVLFSQVTTEFFITCDDDFLFNKDTKIEKFIEIITKTGFDIIGGGVGQNSLNTWRKIARYDITRGSTGHCVTRKNGFYGTFDKYPGCSVGDLVANFFIARTLTAGAIRFDPLFTQMAHREYFLDATGHLRIAVCPEIWAGHDPNSCDGREDEYMKNRKPTGQAYTNLIEEIDLLWYQRNYLKCVADL